MTIVDCYLDTERRETPRKSRKGLAAGRSSAQKGCRRQPGRHVADALSVLMAVATAFVHFRGAFVYFVVQAPAARHAKLWTRPAALHERLQAPPEPIARLC
jgi:hypothetical protein